MGVKWDADWADLLHREAEGLLTPAEQVRLDALAARPGVAQARRRLHLGQAALTSLPPAPLPGSVAARIASEVAWSARLGASPPLPGASVAGAVVPAIGLSRTLTRAAVPPAPHSVAADVAAEVRANLWLRDAPAPPRSLAPELSSEVAWSARLRGMPAGLPASVAPALTARMRQAAQRGAKRGVSPPLPLAPAPRNPAPLLLVSGLIVGLTLLGLTSAWPNLAAGAAVLQALVTQVSPLAGVGLGLLLAASLLVTWRPTPPAQRFGAAAFALSAVLTLPPLYTALGRSGVSVGQNVTVHGQVPGNVIALGGNVTLASDAEVEGEVITLLGDVRREGGARVGGRINALLGRASGDAAARQTAPPSGLSLATASAFRPLLGWLGGAAWGQIFALLTGATLLLLFTVGAAPLLARRQRHAPLRTLGLGILALAALLGPALGLALTGFLAPALLAAAFALLLIATGLSVSAYDLGRTVTHRLGLPHPELLGAGLGLLTVAGTLAWPPLATSLALVGGAWGMGTLLLTRASWERARPG